MFTYTIKECGCLSSNEKKKKNRMWMFILIKHIARSTVTLFDGMRYVLILFIPQAEYFKHLTDSDHY